MNDLTVLERAVLGAATAGSHPVLTRLRGQLDGLRVASRELTGHGFFTDLAVRDPASFDEPWPAQPENWRITAARVKIMGRSAPPE